MENKSREISWVDRVHKRYKEIGILIPQRQENLYRNIARQWAGGRTVMDIGCSTGVGSNLLSHEARYVWGVDVNEEAIDFAIKAFKRPNLDFAVMDIENPPLTKSFAKFDLVIASEVLEHLADVDVGLSTIKKFFKEDTIGFLTAPNGANEDVVKNENKHGYHLQHWTAGDFYGLLTQHFHSVVLYSADKIDAWTLGETVDGNSKDYLIVAKVENAK